MNAKFNSYSKSRVLTVLLKSSCSVHLLDYCNGKSDAKSCKDYFCYNITFGIALFFGIIENCNVVTIFSSDLIVFATL